LPLPCLEGKEMGFTLSKPSASPSVPKIPKKEPFRVVVASLMSPIPIEDRILLMGEDGVFNNLSTLLNQQVECGQITPEKRTQIIEEVRKEFENENQEDYTEETED